MVNKPRPFFGENDIRQEVADLIKALEKIKIEQKGQEIDYSYDRPYPNLT